MDFLNRKFPSDEVFNQSLPLETRLTSAGGSLAVPFEQYGTTSAYLAYPMLQEILFGRGETDPRAMNRQINQIYRGTESLQGAAKANLAGRNLQNSGLGAALDAALGQSGMNQVADLRSREAQIAEQRKRDDLLLFLQMVMGPGIDMSALGLGQYNQNANRSQQREAAGISALAQILSSLA